MRKVSEETLDKADKSCLKLITTIGDRCKMCYTCVRDCPAKAIRIMNGQAEVIADRCVGCGNCVRVCSQNAKQYYNSIAAVKSLLASRGKTAAIIAPSFPAEFMDISPPRFVGMLRKCGFDIVGEVAFGADLVSMEYNRLLADNPQRPYIGSTCPGIVAFVEKYHPDLLENLAPVASPMVAAARAIKLLHGASTKVVFIGPCIAKKAEAQRHHDEDLIEAVLTFGELRTLFNELRISRKTTEDSAFDPPRPGLGALYALSGGILQSADMREDLLDSEVICADGKNNFVEALAELENKSFSPKLLELLCCKGCIAGAGMSAKTSAFARRNAVSAYVRNRVAEDARGAEVAEKTYDKILDEINMAVSFENDDHRLPAPSDDEIKAILKRLGKRTPEDELDCEACGYKTCREHAIAIHKGLAENEMCLPFTIERLKDSLEEVRVSHDQLEETKQALFNAEKLASMGQLSAGIAHEINNPLGVILLNAKIMLDFMDNKSEDYEDIKLIVEQAERCKKIVSGLLDFARKNKVIPQVVDILAFIKNCMRSVITADNVMINVDSSAINDPVFEFDKDQMTQVFTNLIVNATEAMQPKGGKIDITLTDTPDQLRISVADNGPGIPEEYRNKIFEPLFTTKQIGKGTGLGLAVTYGIIKMHHGQITLKSNTDPDAGPTGSEFIISIPRKGDNTNAG